MSNLFLFVGWAVCTAGAIVIVAATWWYSLKMLYSAVKSTECMAVFMRWVLIRHIREVRRDKRKAIDRHVAHTQQVQR